jgi:hypothetical protein
VRFHLVMLSCSSGEVDEVPLYLGDRYAAERRVEMVATLYNTMVMITSWSVAAGDIPGAVT